MGRKLATVTTEEAAAILGVSSRTFRTMRAKFPLCITPHAVAGKTNRQLLWARREVVGLKRQIRDGVFSTADEGSYAGAY